MLTTHLIMKEYIANFMKCFISVVDRNQRMARPKEKFHNPAFLDKSERERSRLKLTLAKQMQKDIGRYEICT